MLQTADHIRNEKRMTLAFTFAAGIQWFEAFEAAKQHNRVIVGGFRVRGSVNAAGGGHSAMSPNYSLGMSNLPQCPTRSYSHNFAGVDNVSEMTIVTADGNHVVTNSYSNPDLFWALRGGGGGTWGVITSVTYREHPSTPFSAAFLVQLHLHPELVITQRHGGRNPGYFHSTLRLRTLPRGPPDPKLHCRVRRFLEIL